MYSEDNISAFLHSLLLFVLYCISTCETFGQRPADVDKLQSAVSTSSAAQQSALCMYLLSLKGFLVPDKPCLIIRSLIDLTPSTHSRAFE